MGEPGAERRVELDSVLLGRWPVVNAHARRFVEETRRGVPAVLAAKLADPQLADHPATEVSLANALAFCVWATERLGREVRLPTGDEWEALALGRRAPVAVGRCLRGRALRLRGGGLGLDDAGDRAPPRRRRLRCRATRRQGVEWVAGGGADGWAVVRGGCYLDHAWGVRASRALAADPARATPTTGVRIAIDVNHDPRSET